MPHSKESKTFITKTINALKTDKKSASFVPIYLTGIPAHEFKNTSVKQMVPHVKDTRKFIQNRAIRNKLKIRVFNPDYARHTIVEVVLNNQPFIMDTIWEELSHQNIEVHHSFHPLLVSIRDKKGELTSLKQWEPDISLRKGEKLESLLHIEFDRQEEKELANIEESLKRVLLEAYFAVADFGDITNKMEGLIKNLETVKSTGVQRKEDISFLRWLIDGNYIFLGYRHYFLKHSAKKISMGLTLKSGLGILRDDKESSIYTPRPLEELPPNMKYYVTGDRILTITRALTKSTVHRRADMDYIGIKEFDSKGRVIGEHRFLGLFSSKAYNANTREIPIIHRKITEVLKRERHLGTENHSYKALINILETYPRDELFQISTDDLQRISVGILHLYERRKVKLFVRRVNHERMISAMIYIPRDKMNSTLRRKIETILMAAYNGESIEVNVQIGESALARIFIKIRTMPPEPPAINDTTVEKLVVEAASSWEDDMRTALIDLHGEHKGLQYFSKYAKAFRAGYRENTSVHVAVQDIANLSTLNKNEDFHVALYPNKDSKSAQLKVFRVNEMINLSSIMPMFDNMGLFVKNEHPNRVSLPSGDTIWIHDFTILLTNGHIVKDDNVISTLSQALTMAWRGELESDSLNRLLLTGKISVRSVIILRAYVAYMQQIGIKYPQEYIRDTLVKHSNIANMLANLFDARFDINLSKEQSNKKQKDICKKFNKAMNDVAVLDEDVILTRFKAIIVATMRTNAWQRKDITDPLAFKIRSADVPDLVKPNPLFEIFVYSSHVEGIHLRGGMIARGGLRWSDRPADFRTEILGLMKTQMTKNAVIVPVGSKGGFVLKTPPCDLKQPETCDRDSLMKHVQENYSTFVRSLLSVTDNLINGKVTHPRNVKYYDGDDPYLVVAADKGTATFSDLANSVAIESDYWEGKHNGFWLGDAFASGGSNGYDHKKMGITARGAWECVKHHFRHLGKDIQSEDFSVMAVGDMAGDVFGNGMLLSKHICLKAAYNHMHIFIDPKPNSATSYKERLRLFKNPRLNWSNYESKLISKGGGIFSRKDKSIKLTPQIQEMLDISDKELAPDALIQKLITMDVELIWNGGIGTFVKSSQENHADVGDRANDTIRVNAKDLNAKVIGEGGNLGFTQLARVEYALHGGAINTDAIDNSAGVDCSDHEVNIKILLNLVQANSKLSDKERNSTLAKMTNEVGLQVLKDNYYHSQALSIKERASIKDHATNKQLMINLEKKGSLDLGVEFLPAYEDLDARFNKGKGLTRPELSILLAYAKMDVYDEIISTKLPDEKCLEHYLVDYFPTLLQTKYLNHMNNHRLNREIIATQVANEIVNRMGPTFLDRMMQETGSNNEDISRAYLISRSLINAQNYWEVIESLDNKVSMDSQMKMLESVKKLVEYTTFWFLRNGKSNLDIAKEVTKYSSIFTEISETLTTYQTKDMVIRHKQRIRKWKDAGLPVKIAQQFSLLSTMTCAPDVARISIKTKQPVKKIMELHFMVGERLGVDELHKATRNIPISDNWQRVGSLAIIDDLYSYQQKATSSIASNQTKADAKIALDLWTKSKGNSYNQYDNLLAELKRQPVVNHAMLNVALGQLKGLLLDK
jgi:glutamate dehydrogenase